MKRSSEYKLTKDELAEAIVRYLGMKDGCLFFPYNIEAINIHLPDLIRVKLKYISKGSFKNEVKHEFNTYVEDDGI
jgi:hypothetical protein